MIKKTPDTSKKDSIPVTWADDKYIRPIGWAYCFDRNPETLGTDETVLSFHISMYDDIDPDLYEACVSANIEEEMYDTYTKTKIVRKARIRMVQLLPIEGVRLGRR